MTPLHHRPQGKQLFIGDKRPEVVIVGTNKFGPRYEHKVYLLMNAIKKELDAQVDAGTKILEIPERIKDLVSFSISGGKRTINLAIPGQTQHIDALCQIYLTGNQFSSRPPLHESNVQINANHYKATVEYLKGPNGKQKMAELVVKAQRMLEDKFGVVISSDGRSEFEYALCALLEGKRVLLPPAPEDRKDAKFGKLHLEFATRMRELRVGFEEITRTLLETYGVAISSAELEARMNGTYKKEEPAPMQQTPAEPQEPTPLHAAIRAVDVPKAARTPEAHVPDQHMLDVLRVNAGGITILIQRIRGKNGGVCPVEILANEVESRFGVRPMDLKRDLEALRAEGITIPELKPAAIQPAHDPITEPKQPTSNDITPYQDEIRDFIEQKIATTGQCVPIEVLEMLRAKPSLNELDLDAFKSAFRNLVAAGATLPIPRHGVWNAESKDAVAAPPKPNIQPELTTAQPETTHAQLDPEKVVAPVETIDTLPAANPKPEERVTPIVPASAVIPPEPVPAPKTQLNTQDDAVTVPAAQTDETKTVETAPSARIPYGSLTSRKADIIGWINECHARGEDCTTEYLLGNLHNAGVGVKRESLEAQLTRWRSKPGMPKFKYDPGTKPVRLESAMESEEPKKRHGKLQDRQDEICTFIREKRAMGEKCHAEDVCTMLEEKFGVKTTTGTITITLRRWRKEKRGIPELSRGPISNAKKSTTRNAELVDDKIEGEVKPAGKTIPMTQLDAIVRSLDRVIDEIERSGRRCSREDLAELVFRETSVSITPGVFGNYLRRLRKEIKQKNRKLKEGEAREREIPKLKSGLVQTAVEPTGIKPSEMPVPGDARKTTTASGRKSSTNIRLAQYKEEIVAFMKEKVAQTGSCYPSDVSEMLMKRHALRVPSGNVKWTVSAWRRGGNKDGIPNFTHWNPNLDKHGNPRVRKERFWADKAGEIKQFITERQARGETVTHADVAEMLSKKYSRRVSTKGVSEALVVYRRTDNEFPYLYSRTEWKKPKSNTGFWADHKEEILRFIREKEDCSINDVVEMVHTRFGRVVSYKTMRAQLSQWKSGIRRAKRQDGTVTATSAPETALQQRQEEANAIETSKLPRGFWIVHKAEIHGLIDSKHAKGEPCTIQEIVDHISSKHGINVTRHGVEVALCTYRKNDPGFPYPSIIGGKQDRKK